MADGTPRGWDDLWLLPPGVGHKSETGDPAGALHAFRGASKPNLSASDIGTVVVNQNWEWNTIKCNRVVDED